MSPPPSPGSPPDVRRLAVLAVAALAVALVLGACGRFGVAEDAEPTASSTTRAEGADADGRSTTSAEPATSPTSAATAQAPTTTTAPVRLTTTTTDPQVVRDGIENRSTVDTDGWRITLTVGERATHFTDERVLFEVRLTNRTDRVRHHEIRQPDLVVIADVDEPERAVWDTRRCNPTSAIEDGTGGLRAVEPGESVPFQTEYPMSCRLPAGTYAVFGQVAVCPDDARIETPNPGTFRCDEDRVELLASIGVPLRLVDR